MIGSMAKFGRGGLVCIFALFCLVSAILAASIVYSPDIASAQSSVRPPANATTNSVPSRSTQPVLSKDGKVPGNSLGNRSTAEFWRSMRQGLSGKVSIPDQKAGQLIQSGGEQWRAMRNGPLPRYGAIAMAAMVGLVLVFFLLRGRIRIDQGASGRTITRFMTIERVAHWLLAISFIVLALTGLNLIYGKQILLPLIGKSSFSSLTLLGKMAHIYVGFAFMVGLALVILLWIKDNFPTLTDIKWIAKGGGILVKGVHPAAKKFNFGQKIIFWLVALGGISISLSGISLMFPFEINMFAKTFAILNTFGAQLPIVVTPMQEMQYATLWHGIVALFLICLVIAHIYIGTLGMEGAFDAMGSGEVDENWAKEHHSIWYEEAKARQGESGAQRAPDASTVPAE